MSYFLNNIDKENDFLYITKNKYFVDKTKLLEKFNKIMDKHENKFVCITRPRRFGKSINASMLASYYAKNLDTKDVFNNLKIAKCDSYEKYLNKHNVIYISFNTESNNFKTYDEYKNHLNNLKTEHTPTSFFVQSDIVSILLLMIQKILVQYYCL